MDDRPVRAIALTAFAHSERDSVTTFDFPQRGDALLFEILCVGVFGPFAIRSKVIAQEDHRPVEQGFVFLRGRLELCEEVAQGFELDHFQPTASPSIAHEQQDDYVRMAKRFAGKLHLD